MANAKEIYLTQEGLDDLKRELDYLKLEKRPEVINLLKEARALGDLSENAEYDAARTAQAEVESKIKEIEVMLENAVVISGEKSDTVSIGSNVKIKYVDDDEIEEYTIVGSKEADPFENKISNESPIGKALLGSKKNQTVDVEAPAGIVKYKVLSITK